MENHKEIIIEVVKKRSLANAFNEYSSRISHAPKKRIRVNGYNSYTPQGQMTKLLDKSVFMPQLTTWKKTKLFPYFLALGFTTAQLNDAWKIWKYWYKY